MKLRTLVPLLIICFSLPTCLLAQDPEVEWVSGTDFTQFHTFTWAKPPYPIQDPDASLGMARAVQDELQLKGIRFIPPEEKFDIFVTYNAKVDPDLQDSSRKLLTLRVRIFDSKNNNVIWRAGGSFVLGNDKQQNRSSARDLLAAMFRKYPPSE
jgi:hypothetical protein